MNSILCHNYWKTKLKNILSEFYKETNSEIAKNILNNYDKELNSFKQICPEEMLDKLESPFSNKDNTKSKTA